jgi:hypothetical protein
LETKFLPEQCITGSQEKTGLLAPTQGFIKGVPGRRAHIQYPVGPYRPICRSVELEPPDTPIQENFLIGRNRAVVIYDNYIDPILMGIPDDLTRIFLWS